LRRPIGRHGSDVATTARGPDWLAPLRADQPRQGRRPSRRWRPCAMRRQRAEGRMHAADHARPGRSPGMAQGAVAAGSERIVPQRAHGGRLSTDSIQSLRAKHVRAARERCPSLTSKRVSPHVLRHSAAMELVQAGVDCSVIALWLGHREWSSNRSAFH
jgi:integrase